MIQVELGMAIATLETATDANELRDAIKTGIISDYQWKTHQGAVAEAVSHTAWRELASPYAGIHLMLSMEQLQTDEQLEEIAEETRDRIQNARPAIWSRDTPRWRR